jgi:RNA polymerase sigma factor (sigma-70 family)
MTEITPRLRRFIEIIAAERTHSNPDLFDECVQEGMIAAWQAMTLHPGKDDVYYRAAAKNGVMAPLRGRSSFGHESQRGTRDAASDAQPIWGTNEAGEDVLLIEPAVEAPYAALEVQDVVRDAVAHLDDDDRVIVFARFWEGMTYPEVADLVGTRSNRLQWRWSHTIRPALRDALEPVSA